MVEELRGSHIEFIARYYRDPTSSLPALSPQEARKLASLGLKIVAVWEQNSPDPENLSYSSGHMTRSPHTNRRKQSVNRPEARFTLPLTSTRMS